MLQAFRSAIRRENDHDPFGREQLTQPHDRAGEVAVGSDEQRGVEAILKSIDEQLRGDVHIGHFFIVLLPLRTARMTLDGFRQVVAEIKRRGRQSREGLEIGGLSAGLCRISVGGRDAAREILHAGEELVPEEQGTGYAVDIEPVKLLPALGFEAEEEVEPVDVGDDALRSWSRDRKGHESNA